MNEHPMTPPSGPPAPPESQSAEPQWHRDFPIDVPQDNYVARRDFTKFMVLTSLAFVVGQFWIGVTNALRRRRGQTPLQHIVQVDQLAVGAVMLFDYPTANDHCLLARTGPDTFVAYGQKCTHLSCAVQPDVPSGRFLCPCHHGVFDMATGRPLAGPPRRPLPRIVLEVRNGAVYAAGVEERML